MNKSLDQILQETRTGGRPEYDELRYALLAMEALFTFASRGISNLALAQHENKAPLLVYSAAFQHDENRRRLGAALSKPPKEWLGPNHDPDDPAVQERRKAAVRLFESMMNSAGKDTEPMS